MVKQINEKEFSSEIDFKGTILVDFYASWCPPCKALAPVLEEISNSRKYKIAKVNVDDNPSIAGRFNIDTVPTLIVFKDGKAVEKSVGYINKDEVMQLLDKHMD